jgi:hypothetical protein
MVVYLVHWLLSVAVPNHSRHIIWCACQDVSMEWWKPNSFNGKLVTCKHHNREVSRSPEIPNFNSVVGRACSYEILIFVKVYREHFVVMSVDFLDVFTWT